MKVELVRFTADALGLLVDTKNTRMGGKRAEEMTEEEKMDHLQYMLKTIKSSWEFVDFTFEITGVSRAFTQQLERHRPGSYAERTMRALDLSSAEFIMPAKYLNDMDMFGLATDAFVGSQTAYEELVQKGSDLQDARSVMPLNTATGVMVKLNLRSMHELAKVRLCARTQGEYQRVFRKMREAVIAQYPWTEDFIQVACVADGICAFENYGKKSCPHWDPRMDLSQLKAEMKIKFWSAAEMAEANPVANAGKSM